MKREIKVNMKWLNNDVVCMCLREDRCKHKCSCEEDVVLHDPYMNIKDTVNKNKYRKEKGRYRQL